MAGLEQLTQRGVKFLARFTGKSLQSEPPKVNQEIYLGIEWQKQADNLADLFAKELALTKEEYIASLPKFEPQPKKYKGRLDIPLIVETRIPLKKMLELLDVLCIFDVDSIKYLGEGRFRTPSVPYTTWLNDGICNLNRSADDVCRSLKSFERGGSIYDGIGLYLKNPGDFNNHSKSFFNSQDDLDTVLSLGRLRGRLRLRHESPLTRMSDGWLVASKKIIF